MSRNCVVFLKSDLIHLKWSLTDSKKQTGKIMQLSFFNNCYSELRPTQCDKIGVLLQFHVFCLNQQVIFHFYTVISLALLIPLLLS